jgi:hypothetical protein
MGMPWVGMGCMRADQEGDYVHVHYAVTNTIHASQTQAHYKSSTCCVLHLLLSNCDIGTEGSVDWQFTLKTEISLQM